MIKFLKSTPYKKTAEKKVNLLEETGEEIAVSCYIYGGQLHSGAVCERMTHSGDFPQGAYGLYYSPEQKSLFVVNGTVYDFKPEEGGSLTNITNGYNANCYFAEYLKNGKNTVVIGSGNIVTEYSEGLGLRFSLSHSASSAVLNCGRLFFAEESGQTVYWTGLGGADDWTAGIENSGKLTLSDRTKGSIIKLFALEGKIILVREQGITVMRAYGSPENFKIDSTSFATDKIIPQAIAVCGERLCFMTQSGLYSFNGSSVEKEENFDARSISAPVCACGLNGKYYLSCFSQKLQKEAVVCFDLALKVSYLINVSATAMCAGDCVYLVNGTGAFRLCEPQEFYCDYTTAPISFGSFGKKALRCVYLSGVSSGFVTVKSDTAERVFKAEKCVRVNMSGNYFTFKLSGGCRVNSAIAVAEV